MINIVGGIGGSHGITSAITGHAHKHIYVYAYMCLRYTDKLPATMGNHDGKSIEYYVYCCSVSGVN